MKSSLIFSFAATVLLCIGCGKFASSDTPAPVHQVEPDPACFVHGTVNVRFSEDVADAIEAALKCGKPATSSLPATKAGDFDAILSTLGASELERVFPYDPVYEARQRREGLHLWYRVKIDSLLPPTKAASGASLLPGATEVEVPRLRQPAAYDGFPFNDPYAVKYQWPLYNDGSICATFRKGADINVVPVWERYTAGSKSVTVAVVDGGIDTSHPDLAAVTIPAGENGSINLCIAGSPYTLYPFDHGTHVAGIIGAVNNNGKYGCGVAGGNDGTGGVRLLSCQVFMYDVRYSGTRHMAENIYKGSTAAAITWACNRGALICNCSWGYLYSSEAEALQYGSIDPTDKAAIDYFIKYAGCDADGNRLPDTPMKGGLVVFAAGNNTYSCGWPAMYEPVIAVGALSPIGQRACYTNYGPWVDISAPGGDYDVYQVPESMIWSTSPMSSRYVDTFEGAAKEFCSQQGSSMSVPFVCGVAALIVSYFGDPDFTVDLLKERLICGADRSYESPFFPIGPRLDAYGSFTYDTNKEPELIGAIRDTVLEGPAFPVTLMLSDVFSDPNNDPLTYQFESVPEGIFDVTVTGDEAVLKTRGYGYADVTVTAVDPCQKSCSTSFRLLSRNCGYNAANGVDSDPFDLYPNPVSDVLHIRPSSTEGSSFDFSLYSPQGVLVFSSEMKASAFDPATLDVSGLAPGCYGVRIASGNGLVYNYPVVCR